MLAAHRSMAVGLAILRPIAWENVCLAPCKRKITNIRNRKQMWIVWGKNKGALYIRKGKDYSLKKFKSEHLRHWTKYIHTFHKTQWELRETCFRQISRLQILWYVWKGESEKWVHYLLSVLLNHCVKLKLLY